MGSQTDLDQGGSYRTWMKQYLGPSVGWQTVPYNNLLAITAIGEYTAVLGTTLITVDVNGAVTINLPKAANPPVGPQSIPIPFANMPITVVDIGGFAGDNPITLVPAAGETIMGLASIEVAAAYGGWHLVPDPVNATWTTTP